MFSIRNILITFTQPFLLGKPKTILDPDILNNVIVKENKMWLENVQIDGLIRGKFLAPRTLFPFLLIRHEKKSYGVICKKCLVENLGGICRHKDEERSFVDCYTIQEVAFAVNTCGYKILQIYELFCYT